MLRPIRASDSQDNPRDGAAMFAAQLARRASGFPRNIPSADLQEIYRHSSNHDASIMNPSPSPQTPDLEKLRKAVQEYQPNPHRVPFNNLKSYHDVIVALRRKKASYEVIAELLQQHGVKTSRARVAEYGRVVLRDGKTRKRRRPQRTASAPAPAVAPIIELKPQPAHTPEQPTHEPQRTGPRIARVRLMDGSIAGEQRPATTL